MQPYLKRALRTFSQAFAASLVMTISSTDLLSIDAAMYKKFIFSLILSAIAGGLSALMNLNEKENK